MPALARRAALLAVLAVALACATETPPSTAALPLERTHWRLVNLGANGAPVAETQTEAFLSFGEPRGRVSGSGGCNRLAGAYRLSGDQLSFGPLAGTRMACVNGMEVESALHAALERTAAFRIDGDRLELVDSAGAVLATFRAGDTPAP